MVSTVWERINDLIEENELSGEQVAKTLGVSFPSVSQWRHKRSNISVENMFKLAKLFNCSLDYLVGRTNEDYGYTERKVDFVTRLQEILSKNNISIYRLDKSKILLKSTYYTWLKGTSPRVGNLLPIADYFDCTLDYLLGC